VREARDVDLLASAGLLFSEAMEAPCLGGDKEEIRPSTAYGWSGASNTDKRVWAPLLPLPLQAADDADASRKIVAAQEQASSMPTNYIIILRYHPNILFLEKV
jgi:hypothetical protein